MKDGKAPVPVSPTQWPEARSHQRVYGRNPEYQARFVMALLGFRQDLKEWTNDDETVQAIDVVIRAFHGRHPEFMQDGFVPDSDFGADTYHLDERLRVCVSELLGHAAEPEGGQLSF